MTPLEKMFWEELGESLHSEEMLAKAMFRMGQAVTNESLGEVIKIYRSESQNQALKVRMLFDHGDAVTREKKSDGMMALLTKAQQLVQRGKPGPLLDAALLAMCVKVASLNHLSYTILRSWAALTTDKGSKILVALDDLIKTARTALVRFENLKAVCDQAAAGAVLQEKK